MAMDHNQGRRGHFHRGRRGPDRRGPERRQGPPPDPGNRPERTDRIDVEQVMREIRTRIAQRSGVELSNQQIQELAGRRLEAILDPRGLKPELLDQLRRSAGERAVAVDVTPTSGAESYPFDEATLYDSPNALLRFFRKLLNPVLRLMFNPTPIAHALAVQSRLNAEIAAREAERDRRQAEWNALHFEILQRLALEVSRGSIDAQNLMLRVESLAAKVDFNDRRVRAMEGTQVRTVGRPQETAQPGPTASSPPAEPTTAQQAPPVQSGDAPRRRRRRRRGRRGAGVTVPADASSAPMPPGIDAGEEDGDVDEGFEDDAAPEAPAATAPPTEAETSAAPERLAASEPVVTSSRATESEPIASERMTPNEEAAHPAEPVRDHEHPRPTPEE
jgi:hypothetical protein